MELLEKYFAELIQCIDASYLVIGIILVFLSVPDTADYAPYRKAKYFLASAFFVMFINLYLWLEIFSSQDWEALNSIIACMDISLFFLTCICFAYSFASLLENYENLFGARLQQWVDDKKYLSSQLTIDSLASEMGTNKVYLSRYINGKHAVNFSTWITTLRIKEAQAYMLAHPGAKLEEVAYHVGFSSASYFSRVFSRIVKTSPTIWRSNI